MTTQINENKMADKLVDKAIEVFSVKGYEATKLTDITNALHISRGPVYYHFKDKYGLYLVAYNQFENGLLEIHNRVIAQDKHIIRIMEDVIYEFVNHIKRFGVNFFFNIQNVDELESINKRYNTLNCRLYQDKLELVKKAIEEGVIRSDINPKEVVDLVYLVYFGIIDGLNLKVIEDYPDRDIKNMVNVLLRGIERYCCD
ncbi:MAG: TetR/AcrR family transcriptional regulator [Eubacteriaceae bacterium]